MTVQKTGLGSTLSIVNEIRARLAGPGAVAGRCLRRRNRRSISFRARAIKGVITEAVIAAALTALMVLLFLVAGAAP